MAIKKTQGYRVRSDAGPSVRCSLRNRHYYRTVPAITSSPFPIVDPPGTVERVVVSQVCSGMRIMAYSLRWIALPLQDDSYSIL